MLTNTEAVRPYENEGDVKRAAQYLSQEGRWVNVSCRDRTHFKFGGIVDQGLICALKPSGNQTLTFARFFDYDLDAPYAHNAIFEVFNSPEYDYCEIEVHAPLAYLEPGQETSHRQVWHVNRHDGKVPAREILDLVTRKLTAD